MNVTLSKAACLPKFFHTSPQTLGRVWTALNLPRNATDNQIKLLIKSTKGTVKHPVYAVDTDAGTCIFKASIKGRLHIYTTSYDHPHSFPLYKLTTTSKDSHPRLVFRTATPPLLKKVSSVVLKCGEEELEFSESQAPHLPPLFLKEIQRLISKKP